MIIQALILYEKSVPKFGIANKIRSNCTKYKFLS